MGCKYRVMVPVPVTGNCWNRFLQDYNNWPYRKKILAWLLFAFVVLLIILIPVWLSHSGGKKNPTNSSTLTSLSQFYLDNLDSSVQPCDNFYAFVCGNAIRRYKAENKTDFGTLKLMKERALESLETLLSQPESEADSKLVREFKVFHAACMNEERIKADGLTPIKKLLKELDGLPLFGNGTLRNGDWVDVVERLNIAGILSVFPYRLGSYPDPTDSNNTSPSLTFFLTSHKIRHEIRLEGRIYSIAMSLGAVPGPRLLTIVVDLMNFEKKLAEISKSNGTLETFYSVAQLPAKVPGIPVDRLLNNSLVSSGQWLRDYDKVVFPHPQYNEKVANLLKNTSDEVLRNYVVWKVVESWMLAFHSENDAPLSLVQKDKRSRDCLKLLADYANVGLGYVYIEKFLDQATKEKAEAILKNIKDQAENYLWKNQWIDSAAKGKIRKNLKNVREYVAYANEVINIENRYENLSFDRNATFFVNFWILLDFHKDFQLRQLLMTQQEHQLLIPYQYALKAGARFSKVTNSTCIVADLLQSPLFHLQYPEYVNYGGLGSIIGHEIALGLDIPSAFKNVTNGSSYGEFEKRIGCLEQQYGDYEIAQVEHKVNGKRTLEENLSDVIGLHVAYNAFKQSVRGDEGTEFPLPKLNYSAEQMYWISAASIHCSYQDDTELLRHIDTDKHVPAEARVNVGFSLIQQFSTDFNCSLSSTMNRAEECRKL